MSFCDADKLVYIIRGCPFLFDFDFDRTHVNSIHLLPENRNIKEV